MFLQTKLCIHMKLLLVFRYQATGIVRQKHINMKHETKQLTENRDTKKQTCISDERPDFNSPTWNETFRIQHTRPKPEQLDGGTRYNLVR